MERVSVSAHVCVDCVAEGATGRPRPTDIAEHPRAPRCATHRRAARKRSALASRAKRASRVYGVPPELKVAYAATYGLRCWVCGPITGHRGRCHDHDHDTGEWRGMLCDRCNRLIGLFRDDPRVLRRLAEYVEAPPAARLPGHSDVDWTPYRGGR